MFYIAPGETVAAKINFEGKKKDMKFRRDDDNRIWIIESPFNKALNAELKIRLSKMKWHGYETKPIKQWSFEASEHSFTQLGNLMGLDVFHRYNCPLKEHPYSLPFKPHQIVAYNHLLTRKQCILAGEMGVGKTLVALAMIEYIKPVVALWVAPASALTSIKLEYKKWKCTQNVRFLTYDGLKKYVSTFKSGDAAPQVVVFDESHKIKNLQSQRSQAAAHLARSMRDEWGQEAHIVCMSGSPAPKSPLDWFSQCHIVHPGFLKESDIHHFKTRLSLIEMKENTMTGGVYPELVTWRDDENKCKTCGKIEDDYNHCIANIDHHKFEKSINEVELLYKRMKGLVLVQFKKDVLKDLPDKTYQIIRCKPTLSMRRSADMLAKRTESTIKALMLLRELSDGFQYVDTAIGVEPCPLCHGHKQTSQFVYMGPPKTKELLDKYNIVCFDGVNPEDVIIDPVQAPELFVEKFEDCPNCDGKGEVKKFERTAQQVFTAKDKALKDLLDEYDEVGRMVIYAGFTQSIDRICEICHKEKWEVIRLDGRGWNSTLGGKPEDLIRMFQEMQEQFPRVVFVGNPGSAGTGLTLTASPVIVFYSNDFNADSRIQAEDRIHRMGMDINRGAKIIDLIHLPTDQYVLDNLQKKKDLQAMSLGQVQEALLDDQGEYDYE